MGLPQDHDHTLRLAPELQTIVRRSVAGARNGTPLLICPSCGRDQSSAGHLCEHCSAPMTPHASTDPVLGILSRGFAIGKATNEPTRLIVVVGMWLWMTPLIVVSAGIAVSGVGAAVEAIARREAMAIIAILAALVGGAILWACSVILFKTTLRFIQQPQPTSHDGSVGGTDDDEPTAETNCLDCGAIIPESATRCPACGWSYSSSN